MEVSLNRNPQEGQQKRLFQPPKPEAKCMGKVAPMLFLIIVIIMD